jgi:KaiC/GvpD/RAD55 family RecA-like ATPase
MSHLYSKLDATTILTSEIPEQPLWQGPMFFSKYGVEEYAADGVIVLHYLNTGPESGRTMYVRKMRGTRHSENILHMEFTPKGIVVKKFE